MVSQNYRKIVDHGKNHRFSGICRDQAHLFLFILLLTQIFSFSGCLNGSSGGKNEKNKAESKFENFKLIQVHGGDQLEIQAKTVSIKGDITFDIQNIQIVFREKTEGGEDILVEKCRIKAPTGKFNRQNDLLILRDVKGLLDGKRELNAPIAYYKTRENIVEFQKGLKITAHNGIIEVKNASLHLK